jgi:hypothetical protein
MRAHRMESAEVLWPALVVMAVLVPGALAAEDQEHLSLVTVGSRVRLLAPEISGQRLQGTVAEIGAESLTVDTDGHQRLGVPRRAITRLEVSTGQARHTLHGLAIGAGTGAVLSVVLPKCVNEGCTSEVGFDPTFASIYALGGAMWGALIGSLIKTDRWNLVSLDSVRVAVMPTHGRGVAVTISVGRGRGSGLRSRSRE